MKCFEKAEGFHWPDSNLISQYPMHLTCYALLTVPMRQKSSQTIRTSILTIHVLFDGYLRLKLGSGTKTNRYTTWGIHASIYKGSMIILEFPSILFQRMLPTHGCRLMYE